METFKNVAISFGVIALGSTIGVVGYKMYGFLSAGEKTINQLTKTIEVSTKIAEKALEEENEITPHILRISDNLSKATDNFVEITEDIKESPANFVAKIMDNSKPSK